MNWAKAMCQDEGADIAMESDKEDDDADGTNRKVKFKIYSVINPLFSKLSSVALVLLNLFSSLNLTNKQKSCTFFYHFCPHENTNRFTVVFFLFFLSTHFLFPLNFSERRIGKTVSNCR